MPASIYPTGVTIYYPDKCWNGYTLFQSAMFQGKTASAILIDMNGNVVKQWEGLDGMPNKMLPGGYILGSTGVRNPKYGHQDMLNLIQVDWDGKIVWKFNKYTRIKDPYQKEIWMLRQHHDYQREGNPVGYYVPKMTPLVERGNTMVLCHKDLKDPRISGRTLFDDTIIEITWDGKIVWEWSCSDHFDEMGFSEAAKNTISRDPGIAFTPTNPPKMKYGDWMHMNSISLLGPNKWFEKGDKRFHPENVIWSGRNTNIMGITDKKSGKIVWKLGPDYDSSDALKKLGWIVGQHHVHLIPQGLPGEGNILVFDNGGSAGYGVPNPGAPTGRNNAIRYFSRVLEFDPTSLEVAWCYPSVDSQAARRGIRFFSSYISSAQRMPNGNTVITEGASGRLIEVTPKHEIVWEYVSPFFQKKRNSNSIYRAYRLPYNWVPQLDEPEEKIIPHLDNSNFRVPDSPDEKPFKVTRIQ